MKALRKWSRILHRDIGFFFIGASIVYALSGIALNHMNDWNPNYHVEQKKFQTDLHLTTKHEFETKLKAWLKSEDLRDEYKSHYFPNEKFSKVFLAGGSSIVINRENGQAQGEFLRKRIVFFNVNFLHYNPNIWWTVFSDIFCVALIFLAVSSLIIVKGKRGIAGSGGIYTVLGIVIPLLFLFLLQ